MKRFSTLLLFVATIFVATIAQDYQTVFSQSKDGEYKVSFSINDWKLGTLQTENVVYQTIIFSSSTLTNKKGWAELPFISASIQLPARKNVDLRINYSDYTDYVLNYPLLPSRGTIYRNQNPSDIPYVIDPASVVDKFYPADLATMDEPYIVRDVRGTSIRVFPFQYNAAKNTLRVYSRIDVVLTENNEKPTNPLLRENPTPVKESIGMYQSLFLNYTPERVALAIAQYGDILVITTPRDSGTINPYIQWKREKGYKVSKEVVANGTNVKTLIQQKYNANNNIMYVQLVGGWNEIKSDLGTSGNGPMDPKMGCVVGTDNYPDVSVGRFSCSNTTELQTQINKAIEYEKNPNMDPNWRESMLGMGTCEGSGQGDDGEADYLHIQRIYSQRLQTPKFTYNQFYQQFQGYGATTAGIANNLNSGVSTLAYCGHGAETSFWFNAGCGTPTGAIFGNTNINQLTNGNKLPFIVSVACVNGSFHNQSGSCFAEVWLKKQNGGAVVTWMSTINQAWTPPMRGQDYFYDILIGGFDYSQYSGQSGKTTNEQRTIWGSLVVNAANLMLSQSSTTDDVETIQTWTTFGDANLQLRTKQPDAIESSNNLIMMGMPFETTITSNGAPVANAMVSISKNNVYYSALTDASGKVSITNDFTPGDVLLVVTAFNTTTIYQTIGCIPMDNPYIIIKNSKLVDADSLTYISQNNKLAVTLKNLGAQPTSGVLNVTLSCDDPKLIINNPVAQCAIINSNDTADVIFNISVANNIADNTVFPVKIKVTDADNVSWEGNISLNAYAPKFAIDKILINNVLNGTLESGIVAKLTVVLKNIGNADAYNVKGNLQINRNSVDFACDESINPVQDVLPAGATASYNFDIISGADIISPNALVLLISADYDLAAALPVQVQSASSAYCTPASSDCSLGDKFTSVRLIKSSDQTVLINNTDASCSTNGYSDFTNIAVTLIPGQQYDVKTIIGRANNRVRGWLDFNGNNAFDSNELLINITSNTANVENGANFTVPATAVPGTYRMRLRTASLTSPTACDAFASGQTHDYTIIIPERYPRAENVTGIANNMTATITWDEPQWAASGFTLAGYNIYRNKTMLNSAILTERTFTEQNLAEGAYVYNVAAVYTDGKESLQQMSNVVCVKNITLTENNNATEKFVLYPNPAKNEVFIETQLQIDKVEFTDIAGRTVNFAMTNGKSINVSTLPAGVYLVKIYSQTTKTEVKRLIVIK